MNKKQAEKILMKSRLMSRSSRKGVVVRSAGSGCAGCGRKKTEQSINRLFGRKSRG